MEDAANKLFKSTKPFRIENKANEECSSEMADGRRNLPQYKGFHIRELHNKLGIYNTVVLLSKEGQEREEISWKMVYSKMSGYSSLNKENRYCFRFHSTVVVSYRKAQNL